MGKGTCIVLDQDTEESLQRSQQSAVNHVWTFFHPVTIHKGRVEAFVFTKSKLHS